MNIKFDPFSNFDPAIIDNHYLEKAKDGIFYLKPKTLNYKILRCIRQFFPYFRHPEESLLTIRDAFAELLTEDRIKNYSPAQGANLYANLSYFSERVITRHNSSWKSNLGLFFWSRVEPLDNKLLGALTKKVLLEMQEWEKKIHGLNRNQLNQLSQFLEQTRVLSQIQQPDLALKNLWLTLHQKTTVLIEFDTFNQLIDSNWEKALQNYQHKPQLEDSALYLAWSRWMNQARLIYVNNNSSDPAALRPLKQDFEELNSEHEKLKIALRPIDSARTQKIVQHLHCLLNISEEGKYLFDKWNQIKKCKQLIPCADVDSLLERTQAFDKYYEEKDVPFVNILLSFASEVKEIVYAMHTKIEEVRSAIINAHLNLLRDMRTLPKRLSHPPQLSSRDFYFSKKHLNDLHHLPAGKENNELQMAYQDFLKKYEDAEETVEALIPVWKVFNEHDSMHGKFSDEAWKSIQAASNLVTGCFFRDFNTYVTNIQEIYVENYLTPLLQSVQATFVRAAKADFDEALDAEVPLIKETLCLGGKLDCIRNHHLTTHRLHTQMFMLRDLLRILSTMINRPS